MCDDLMPCLSVKQPWAELLVTGQKDVENRGWHTEYRGPVLIHASATRERGRRVGGLYTGSDTPLSAIIGMVELYDIVGDSSSRWAVDGQYHWLVRNPVRFAQPVSCKGALKLWYPPAEVLEQLSRELRAA